MADNDAQPIIIVKKVKGHGHGHHGGAWKVAYADFVTAMMAFFLLLWLLNATTEEQRKGIADYFSPESLASPTSGAGDILGGRTIAIDGAMVSNGGPTEGASVPLPPLPTGDGEGGVEGEEMTSGDGGEGEPAEAGETDFAEDGTSELAEDGTTDRQFKGAINDETLDDLLAKREQEQFEAAAEALRQAIQSVPALEALKDSLIIEQTPEGLRIQLVDQEGYSMFALGSAQPNEQMRKLVELVTKVVDQLPNKISIAGHTDNRPYRSQDGYTNWELSSDRANAARRLLIDSGLDPARVALVQGRSDTEPLLTDEPENPRNRRISVVLLRENAVPIELQDTVTPASLGANETPSEGTSDPDTPLPRKTEATPDASSG